VAEPVERHMVEAPRGGPAASCMVVRKAARQQQRTERPRVVDLDVEAERLL
jgi:hypothetical protein